MAIGDIRYIDIIVRFNDGYKISLTNIHTCKYKQFKITNYPEINTAFNNFYEDRKHAKFSINCHKFAYFINTDQPSEILMDTIEIKEPFNIEFEFIPQYIWIYDIAENGRTRISLHSLVVLPSNNINLKIKDKYLVISTYNVCSKLFIQTLNDSLKYWYDLFSTNYKMFILYFNTSLKNVLTHYVKGKNSAKSVWNNEELWRIYENWEAELLNQ